MDLQRRKSSLHRRKAYEAAHSPGSQLTARVEPLNRQTSKSRRITDPFSTSRTALDELHIETHFSNVTRKYNCLDYGTEVTQLKVPDIGAATTCIRHLSAQPPHIAKPQPYEAEGLAYLASNTSLCLANYMTAQLPEDRSPNVRVSTGPRRHLWAHQPTPRGSTPHSYLSRTQLTRHTYAQLYCEEIALESEIATRISMLRVGRGVKSYPQLGG